MIGGIRKAPVLASMIRASPGLRPPTRPLADSRDRPSGLKSRLSTAASYLTSGAIGAARLGVPDLDRGGRSIRVDVGANRRGEVPAVEAPGNHAGRCIAPRLCELMNQ